MARDLTRRAALLAALALSAAIASGEEHSRAAVAPLADPTRPPAFLMGSGRATSSAPAGPVLQSVLVSASRKAAIISGQRVELGDRYGESRLTRLSDAEAVLEGPGGRTVLKLVPGVEKKTTVARPDDRERDRHSNTSTAPRGDRAPQ